VLELVEIMEQLILTSISKVQKVKTDFSRFLMDEIKWKNRLIAIMGARGSGKTTLILQYIKQNLHHPEEVLYVSMDELFFQENNLVELAHKFSLNGGKSLFLDEVHKYPNWSREIKLIYDNHPDLQVVFTSSSILEIYKSESDLSRRVVSYTLPEMSLREFLELSRDVKIPSYTLDEILTHHLEIVTQIIEKVKPIQVFHQYNEYGAYPYFNEGIEEYHQKLINTINLVIEVDILAVENIDFNQVTKIKKLLYAIATSVPFTPNVSKLAQRIQISRPSLLKALFYLDKARLIHNANKPNKGISVLTKPEKIYLNNGNLINAIGKNSVKVGNIRETFFFNQLDVLHKVNLSDKSDFIVDDKYTFEIGGVNKTNKQIRGITDSYIVKDNIEYGVNKVIPLWLFGFLY